MKLKSAREAWSEAYYERWDSISSVLAEQAALGVVESGGFITRQVTEIDDLGKPFTWKQRVYCPPVKQDRSGRPNTAGKAARQTIAGCIQRAIATLPPPVRSFGHHMYSPIATMEDMERAEELVWEWFDARRIYHSVRMTESKRERAYYVAKLCLHRYRRIHQGGMSAGVDPVPNPEAFRGALLDVYGVELNSSAWDRDWQPVITMMMDVCSDIDRAALKPISIVISQMKDAA